MNKSLLTLHQEEMRHAMYCSLRFALAEFWRKNIELEDMDNALLIWEVVPFAPELQKLVERSKAGKGKPSPANEILLTVEKKGNFCGRKAAVMECECPRRGDQGPSYIIYKPQDWYNRQEGKPFDIDKIIYRDGVEKAAILYHLQSTVPGLKQTTLKRGQGPIIDKLKKELTDDAGEVMGSWKKSCTIKGLCQATKEILLYQKPPKVAVRDWLIKSVLDRSVEDYATSQIDIAEKYIASIRRVK